jgi:hypothetical protein
MCDVFFFFTVCIRRRYRVNLFAVLLLTDEHGKGVLCRVPPFFTHGKHSIARQSQIFP